MPRTPTKPVLWSTRVDCLAQAAESLAAWFEERALSLSVTAPPRNPRATVEALFDAPPDAARLQADLAILNCLWKADISTPQIEKIQDLDWLKKVAADFPPLPLARWLVFGAAHRKAVPASKRLKLQIDATSAFGTGEHPTTRGCLLMLDWLLKREKPLNMLDMGCGSGILAMAFAKVHHGHAVAVDNDKLSVSIARENVRQNGLLAHVRVGEGQGLHALLPLQNAPYDLIMANIFARPLCEMAGSFKKNLCPGGFTILSGILRTQANGVSSVYRAQGFRLMRRLNLGAWSVLAMTRPKGPS